MKRIVLIGAGNHATYSIDAAEKEQKYKIVGLTDSNRAVGTDVLGYEVIGKQEDLDRLVNKHKIDAGFICIGDNWTRKRILDKVRKVVPHLEFVSIVHPSVQIGKNVSIGDGTLLLPGTILQTSARVGNFCFTGTNAILEHNCVMEDFSCLSTGAITGGYVTLKKYAGVMIGAVLFDRITVGEHTVVGAGAVVTKSLPDKVIAYGSPARVIRERDVDEPYLK